MAKLALRAYDREVESLIDKGQLDEAIAHCRHILKSFPKHLETYRLLGKAYLESKRYDEAMDIFKRILMAVPDDFVSHVGMSIVNDEKGALDDALWHMERAFEAQPSNPAIQGELQRLYGRRDGVEPPRIRMTRGALAHMYVQGELFPQAISEIKAVLAQDAQRTDMLVLLAVAYFRSGQKADASQVCAQLLKRNPYCYEANRIMVEMLHGKQNVESTQAYRMRANELDPYSPLAGEAPYQPADAPDQSVQLERLDYSGQEVPLNKDWSAAQGIRAGAQTQAEAQPEWLRIGAVPPPDPVSKTPVAKAEPPQPEAGAETIKAKPSTLKETAAGVVGKPDVVRLEPATPDQAENEIPDFLRQAGWKESNLEAPGDSGFMPLSGISQEGSETDSIGSVGDELMPVNLPGWLKDKSPGTQAESAPDTADLPDWLNKLTAVPAGIEKPPEFIHEEAPDWLRGLGESDLDAHESNPPAPAEDLAQTPFTEAGTPEAPVSQPPTAAFQDDLNPPGESLIQEPSKSQAVTEKEQDEALAWLEGLAAKHGAKSDELLSEPSARGDIPPDWVKQADADVESAQSASTKESAGSEQEDETGLWLRGLAQKETLDESAAGEAADEEPILSAEDTPDWLSGLESQTVSEESQTPSATDAPGWLRDLNTEFAPTSESKDQTGSEIPAPEWLKALNTETGLPEAPVASGLDESRIPEADAQSPSNKDDTPPARPPAGLKVDTMPGWLKSPDSESRSAGPAPAAGVEPDSEMDEADPSLSRKLTEQELPDWLRGLDEAKSPATPTIVQSDDMPPWLRSESDEPVTAERSAPTDWRPSEDAPAAVIDSGTAAPGLPVDSDATQTPLAEAATSGDEDPDLQKARLKLSQGDMSTAMEKYNLLIRKGRWLEEIIRDLREAVSTHPIEVAVWQALGDAYMRINRLKEALESYNKAEQLLR